MENYSYIFKIKGLRPLFTQGALSLKVFQSTVVLPWVKNPRSGGLRPLFTQGALSLKTPQSTVKVPWVSKPRSGAFTSQKDRSEKRVTARNPLRGQVLLEVLWLALFTCAFLAVLSHLYEAGKREIELSRGQRTMLHRGVKPFSYGQKKTKTSSLGDTLGDDIFIGQKSSRSSSLKKAKKRSLSHYKKKFFH